jgi:P2 family phage contractile tail tube protein
MYQDVLKNMNLYVDGKGYAGVIEEIVLPKLTLKTEEFRGGGMDIPVKIDMGMEAIETSFTLRKFDQDMICQFGLGNGNRPNMTIRGSMSSDEDGSEFPVVLNLRGIVTEMDFGSWKASENASLKVTVSLRYYRMEVDGNEIHEIDSANMIRKVNGIDLLAETRKNIGL